MVRKKVEKKVRPITAMPDPAEHLPSKSGNLTKMAKTQESGNGNSPAVSRRERIALLAYTYWEQRGRQGGSPDEDWFRAEREIDPDKIVKDI